MPGRANRLRTGKVFDYILAFFFLISLNFFLVHSLPGDPLTALYGEEALMNMDEADKAGLMAEMGLDKPLYIQWQLYLGRLVHLDLGFSYMQNQPVSEVLAASAPWTLLLVGVSLLISVPGGYLLGIEAGWRHSRTGDYILSACMMLCNSLPPFVLAMFFLMFFGFTLRWLPLSGAVTPFSAFCGWGYVRDAAYHLILPSISLACHEIASVFFLSRGTTLTLLDRPFLFVGKAKGLSDHTLKQRYISRNSLAPTISRVGIMAANALTGVLFVEVVFAYPGLGHLAYEAVLSHDYPVIQGVFLLIAVIVFAVNWCTDCLVAFLSGREQ